MLALAGNYQSHLGDRPAPKNPEPFFKASTALLNPEANIVFPPGAQDVHFEGRVGDCDRQKARRVPEEQAADYILGYTCGNDISERNWQGGSLGDQKDVQWWRAKGSDTFAPMGPAIAVGLDYEKSEIQLRLNGEVKQKQRLSDLIFKTTRCRELYQPARDLASRGCDLYGNARGNESHPSRRRGRGRNRRDRSATKRRKGLKACQAPRSGYPPIFAITSIGHLDERNRMAVPDSCRINRASRFTDIFVLQQPVAKIV